MGKFFCKKYPLDKGMAFLCIMDCFGAALYAANIVGVIFGFAKDQEQYYIDTKYSGANEYMTSLNTILIVHASLILSLTSIPRLFAYLYVHEEPLDYFRRRAYYLVRATSCGFLLALQLAAFIAMVYFLLAELSANGSTDVLSTKIIPLLVVYGLALVFSIGLDPYWSVQAYFFHKEGMMRGEDYVLQMRLAKTQKKVLKTIAHGHTNSLTALTISSQTTITEAKFAQEGQRTGVTTPNKTSEGWSASLQSPKEGKELEKENWGEHNVKHIPVADGPIIQASTPPQVDKQVIPAPAQTQQLPNEDEIKKIAEDVWKKQDKDKNGMLSKTEARDFVTHTLTDLGKPVTIDESKFQNLYKECDKNKTGNLSKKEFMVFVGKLILAK